jgi:hypothetical protein
MENGARALNEFAAVCDSDGLRLWGKSLCGPYVLVDARTREAVANRPDPDHIFTKEARVFVGTMPKGFQPSNTSVDWGRERWATAMLPLPDDPFSRLTLVVHESFHRIQPSLGLGASDAANAHLDTEVGRLWLRLELRALARALRDSGAAGRLSAADAMLFRAHRHRLFPGSAAEEAAMEKQEGLPEYTGVVVALRATGEDMERVARRTEDFEENNAFARSFAYGTGPALGLLLDRYAAGWRARALVTPLDAMLMTSLHSDGGGDLGSRSEKRAQLYGYRAVAAAEREREERHQAFLTRLKAEFVDGAVLQFPNAPDMNRNFDPMRLVPVPPHGTYYPTGVFTAAWGKVTVEEGGALVAPDNVSLRVKAPDDPSARPLRGTGWTLDLAPGWTVKEAEHRGSFIVVRESRE